MKIEYLDVTTQIGCPVNCLKYCPQEVVVRNYSGNRRLTIKKWALVLSHLPHGLPICFSGLSEPFANPNTMDFIDMAEEAGHPLALFTTLYQASKKDVERLVRHKFLVFCLHLPDGHVTNFPLSEDYMANVFTVIQNVENVTFCLMNKLFVSQNREKIARDIPSKRKLFRLCSRLRHPNFNLLPNGDVYLCPLDFGLSHAIGNLFTEKYKTIRERFWPKRKNFELCSTCSQNYSLLEYTVDYAGNKIKTHLFNLRDQSNL